MSIESQARTDTETSRSSRAENSGIDTPSGVQSYAVDFTMISRTVKQALEIRLALPARSWVDLTTLKLTGHLTRLIEGDVWEIETPQSRLILHKARELLRDDAQPGANTPPGFAHEHMRNLALATRMTAAVYRLREQDRDRKAPVLKGER